jgi:hypothetical protein
MNQRIQLALTSLVVLVFTAAAWAQEGGIRIKLKAEPAVAPAKVQRTVEQRLKPVVKGGPSFTRTTGALAVVSEPSATIFIQPIGAAKFIDKEDLPATSSQAIFENLKPGKYKVAAELNGFMDGESEVVIVPNKTQLLELHLRPELYNVTVKTNVPTGDVKYRLNKGNVTPQFVRITNGKASITGLRAGEYEVDIKADDAAYSTILATIDVGRGQTEFPVELKYVLCEQVFSESWVSLASWEAPATWKTASRKLTVTGAGWAIPKDDCPRHFADFELTADVRLLNEQGISFIARAHDRKNYYEIQLTGAKAAEPLLMRGIAYVNGVAQPLGRAVPLDAFAPNMTGKYFTVVIKAKANLFKVFINDSSTGDELPLGDLPDPSKHFALGAVGVVGHTGEQTEVARFIVNPIKK